MKTAETIIGHIRNYTKEIYREEEYPALRTQTEEWSRSRPLAGVRILEATPLFTNTLLQYVPLLAAGAELTAATHDKIPFDPALIPLLDEWGLRHVHNDASGSYDCVLDCGGAHASLDPVFGFAELTRSGFYQYQTKAKPVILVDDSRIKTIETCLGTGDGFLRAMKRLGYTDLAGKKIVLFGYGKVGRGIAYYLQKERACVTVVDDPSVSVPSPFRKVDRQDRAAIAGAVREAWCVVTATGIRNAMNGNGAAEILRNTTQLIAAMGIENEWGNSLPEERILHHGQPLNFLLEEPTRLRFIDPTMALLNAAALELVTQKLSPGIRKIRPEVEQHWWDAVERCNLITHDLKGMNL